MPGRRHDRVEVPPLIEGIAFGLIAHKAFYSNALVIELNDRGAKIITFKRAGWA